MRLLLIINLFLIFTFIPCCNKERIVIGPPGDYESVDSEPDWSPVGSMIAYTYHKDNVPGLQIWILDLESMQKQHLTAGRSPEWSPDGKKIAYMDGNIHVIDIESTEITQLDSTGGYFPSWSPDGKMIAYNTGYDNPDGFDVIWIMNADGTNKRNISQSATREWRDPAWSPDGSTILHRRYVGNIASELFLIDTTGANPVQLTENAYYEIYYKWSPDGDRLAFCSYGRGSANEGGIYIMNADGSDPCFLVGGWNPTWSPDSRRIVFDMLDESGDYRVLWIINTDGTGLEQLTFP